MDPLNKLYLELTTFCNLDCQMCVRRAWNEPFGHMPLETFKSLMAQVGQLANPPIIHMSGYGEPMVHPNFLELVRMAKNSGAKVEVTTNGTMLDSDMATALIELDLDRLMVSLDGASPDPYDDIRVNGSFNQVINNLRVLRRLKLRGKGRHSNPQVGISFVAMKRNFNELPKLPWLATYIGAWEIQVSNVVPHTPEMEQEILYKESLRSSVYRGSRWVPDMSLPRLDMNSHTMQPLRAVHNSTVSLSNLDVSFGVRNDYCRFAQEGYAVIRWDGEISPCLPLMHDNPVYLHNRRKDITHYSLGNINNQPLLALWESPEFADFRAKVRDFQFSPCTTCGGCERFPANYVDCSHNTFPTCGGCLWAQGFVQCP